MWLLNLCRLNNQKNEDKMIRWQRWTICVCACSSVIALLYHFYPKWDALCHFFSACHFNVTFFICSDFLIMAYRYRTVLLTLIETKNRTSNSKWYSFGLCEKDNVAKMKNWYIGIDMNCVPMKRYAQIYTIMRDVSSNIMCHSYNTQQYGQ